MCRRILPRLGKRFAGRGCDCCCCLLCCRGGFDHSLMGSFPLGASGSLVGAGKTLHRNATFGPEPTLVPHSRQGSMHSRVVCVCDRGPRVGARVASCRDRPATFTLPKNCINRDVTFFEQVERSVCTDAMSLSRPLLLALYSYADPSRCVAFGCGPPAPPARL
jgi:hypothetical protein